MRLRNVATINPMTRSSMRNESAIKPHQSHWTTSRIECLVFPSNAGIDLFRAGGRRPAQRDAGGVQATLRRRRVHTQRRCGTPPAGLHAQRLHHGQPGAGVTQLRGEHFRPVERLRRRRDDGVDTLRGPRARHRPAPLPQRRQALPERQIQGDERERRRWNASARRPAQYVRKPAALLATEFMELWLSFNLFHLIFIIFFF